MNPRIHPLAIAPPQGRWSAVRGVAACSRGVFARASGARRGALAFREPLDHRALGRREWLCEGSSS